MLIAYKEKTNNRRFSSKLLKPKNNPSSPRKLKTILQKHSGRSNGRITVRHQGGRHKRFYREIDFKRNKFDFTYDNNSWKNQTSFKAKSFN